jgi:transposase InsO family protein
MSKRKLLIIEFESNGISELLYTDAKTGFSSKWTAETRKESGLSKGLSRGGLHYET